MKLELSETSKLSTIPVLPNMSLFNQFSKKKPAGEEVLHRLNIFLLEHGRIKGFESSLTVGSFKK